MNPVPAALLLAFAVAAGFAPWRRAGWTTPVRALLYEAGGLTGTVVLGWVGAGLVQPPPACFRLALLAFVETYSSQM